MDGKQYFEHIQKVITRNVSEIFSKKTKVIQLVDVRCIIELDTVLWDYHQVIAHRKGISSTSGGWFPKLSSIDIDARIQRNALSYLMGLVKHAYDEVTSEGLRTRYVDVSRTDSLYILSLEKLIHG